ncbi:MAG: hypothetical protein IT452_01620 [Planctomycetia bacterium]|nr:hypothetical protein [Planctomycetia bacterium]
MRTSDRTRLAAAGLLFAAFALAGDPPDPKAEWPKKWEALAQKAAREHATIGKWAASKKLHNEAYPEFVRAAELDPANADAQKGLGRRLEGGAWVDDPKTPPKKGAEAPAADVPGLLEEIAKKRAEAAKKLAKEFTTLAEWAQKNGLKDEALGLWRQILDRYDPESEKAHLAVGDVKQDGHWVPPADVAKRDDAAKKLKEAPKGEALKDKTDTEKVLGVSHSKRRSAHFLIEGPYTDDQIAELVQIAETARSLFLELVGRDPEDYPEPIHAVVFKEQEPYGRYVKADAAIPEQDKKAYAAAAGYPSMNPLGFAGWQGQNDWDYVRDLVAHMSVHILLLEHYRAFPYPAWLYEGVSYWITDRLLKTAKVYCSGFSTSAGGGRDHEDVRGWKAEVKRMERDGQDPSLSELFVSDLSGMNMRRSMKAWSVVEWLAAERKKDFLNLIVELRSGSKPEDAAKAALGVKSLAEMEALWEQYVRAKY